MHTKKAVRLQRQRIGLFFFKLSVMFRFRRRFFCVCLFYSFFSRCFLHHLNRIHFKIARYLFFFSTIFVSSSFILIFVRFRFDKISAGWKHTNGMHHINIFHKYTKWQEDSKKKNQWSREDSTSALPKTIDLNALRSLRRASRFSRFVFNHWGSETTFLIVIGHKFHV